MTNGSAHGLNALIVDDEQPARRRLRKLLQPLSSAGRVQIVGEAGDGVEAVQQLSASDVDVVFLDIQMPELNGFEVLDRVASEARPAVIFTTAFDAYALRAFEANAVDYLLKPIGRDRLEEAVSRVERARHSGLHRQVDAEKLNRLLEWLATHDDAEDEEETAVPEAARAPDRYLRQISIPYSERILIVPVSRLVTAEINEGITRLFVLENDAETDKPRLRQHVVSYTLDQLESNLDPGVFMRVHRSAIVQLSHVRELIPWFSGRFKLLMTGDHEVIASRERSKQLKDELML